MNTNLISIVLLLITIDCVGQADQLLATQHYVVIDSMIEEKSFFQAKSYFNRYQDHFDKLHLKKYEAQLGSLFGRFQYSNQVIESIIQSYNDKLEPRIKRDLLLVKLSNSIKLFDYSTATKVSEILISDFQHLFDQHKIWSLQNDNIIWKALKDNKTQQVNFLEDCMINLHVDEVGLKNINVQFHQNAYPFIFDTGANLSVINRSLAEELGMEIKEVVVEVNTITGALVEANIAVANKFKIGKITLSNVVFLILPDKTLSFPQYNYKINGILGYPVLSALKEMHFLPNDKLFIPKKSKYQLKQNLAIEYLTPYINLRVNNEPVYFSFDTGAKSTLLYHKYYQQFQSAILPNTPKSKIKYAGAGGAREREGYRIDCNIQYGEQIVQLKSIGLFSEANADQRLDEQSFGNLGQDFISQFDKMVINFEKMFIHFE